MARGRDRHDSKKAALAGLGKDLARRARSRCELCEAKEALQTVSLWTEDEPSLEATVLLCGRCDRVLQGKRDDDLDGLRFLESAVWAESMRTQALAIVVLNALVEGELAPWARPLQDSLWIGEEVQAFIDRIEL